MHLHIPQTQIDSNLTLGILEAVRFAIPPTNAISTEVTFILKRSDGCPREYWFWLMDEIDKELRISGLPSNDSSREILIGLTHRFTLSLNGELRNRSGFLKSVASKVSKVHNKLFTQYLAQQAADTGDTEEWCKLMGAKRSPLNQWP